MDGWLGINWLAVLDYGLIQPLTEHVTIFVHSYKRQRQIVAN